MMENHDSDQKVLALTLSYTFVRRVSFFTKPRLFKQDFFLLLFLFMFMSIFPIIPRTTVVILMEYKDCQFNFCKANRFFSLFARF